MDIAVEWVDGGRPSTINPSVDGQLPTPSLSFFFSIVRRLRVFLLFKTGSIHINSTMHPRLHFTPAK